MPYLKVDHDYIPTFNLQLVAGRNFSQSMPTDSAGTFIINKTAVKKFGWMSSESVIGKAFGYGNKKGIIIGVVKELHFDSLHC